MGFLWVCLMGFLCFSCVFFLFGFIWMLYLRVSVKGYGFYEMIVDHGHQKRCNFLKKITSAKMVFHQEQWVKPRF